MAIDANRVKYSSNVSSFFGLLWRFSKRVIVLAICFGAFQLLYLTPSHRLSTTALEVSGNIVTMGIKFYDTLLKPIHFSLNHLNMLNDLHTENIELKLKLEKYKSLEATASLLESENAELRKMLHVIPDAKYKRKTARLLSISLNPFSKTILIGAGSNDGIVSDQVVASDEGLIGRVIQVSENYSKVMLINDFNSRIPVISSLSHERAILTGDNSKINLSYLPEQNTLKVSEIILTSGDGKIYPYGIPVAEVISIEEGKILLKPIMNLSTIEFVHVYSPAK